MCVHGESCLTLCKSMDCSLPGSSVYGVFQARILEQFPYPTPGDLPNPGIEPASLVSPALAGRFFTTAPPRKPQGEPIGHTICKLPDHTLGHIFQVTHLGTKQNTALVPKRP